MGSLFSIDSPLMKFLTKVADLVILNLLFILFSLPIFTIGASMTALYYVSLKMADNTEGSIVKQFVKSFTSNFKQATIIWLIAIFAIIVFGIDIYAFIRNQGNYASPVKLIVFIFGIIIVLVILQVFAILAKFDNTVGQTIKNTFVIALTQLIKSVAILAFWIIPPVAVFFNLRLLPVMFTVGFSVPAYLSSLLFLGTFDKIINPEPLPERKFKDPFEDDEDNEKENEEENEACEKAEDNKIEDVNDNSKNENLEQIKEDIVEEK